MTENEGRMRLLHGTDEPGKDRSMLRKIRCWEVFSAAAAAVFAAGIVYALSYAGKGRWICVVCGCFAIGFLLYLFAYVTWESGRYRAMDEGLYMRSLFRTKTVSWDAVTGCGVYAVLEEYGRTMPYIVLFLSRDRYGFPMARQQCFFPGRKMVVVRYSEERFLEIAEFLDKHGVMTEYVIPAVRKETETEAAAPAENAETATGEKHPRLLHGTDEPKHDSMWRWSNRFWLLLVFLLLAGFVVGIITIARSNPDITVLIPCGLLVIGCGLSLGYIYYGTWRNSCYTVTDDYLEMRSILGTSRLAWEKIVSWGVYPVCLIRSGMPRPYIILWRTRDRVSFQMDIDMCSFHEKQMIIIRFTEERLREIAEQMDKHGIPMERSELSDYL